jgi:hypothetical protein
MSKETFDKAYDAEVRHAAIDLWIATDDGRLACAGRGVNPEIFKRFTEYGYDSMPRISEARELVVFRLDRDVDRLIEIVETLILRHLKIVP